MRALIEDYRDKLFGRGKYAITIPIFDGALKPNRLLEEARTVATFENPEDVVVAKDSLFVANGRKLEILENGNFASFAEFDGEITALAAMGDSRLVVAVDGNRVLIEGGTADDKSWQVLSGIGSKAINSLHGCHDGRILISNGSSRYSYDKWCYDLMAKGQSGQLLIADPDSETSDVRASNLHFAFGACAVADRVWVSETWRHRVVSYDNQGNSEIIVDDLPGYPCRLSPASDGGCWLSVFAGRTQLVEFVLRESAYRKRMVAELDPRFWIAPALSSGDSFLEPLQGAGVKMRGVMKPWAPPRSYGLVIKLSATGAVEYSLHSRLDGKNHGIVASAEYQGKLYALSKGSRRLLELEISAPPR